MYVKEMHIEVNQAIQKLGANLNRKLFDSELDWVLNKGQDRFIASRVTPKEDGSGGYEINSFNTDAIRTLMKTGMELTAYISNPRRFASVLPGDYAYMVSDETVLKRLLTGDLPAKALLSDTLTVIPLRTTTATANYYAQVQVTLNGRVEFDIQQFATDRGAVFSGYSSPDELFNLPNLILTYLTRKRWNVHWESYGDQFFPKSLIIVNCNSGSVLIDGTTTAGTAAYFSYQTADLPMRPTEDSNNRLCGSHIVNNLREAAFYKTQPESPISELVGRRLFVYADPSFIVTNTRIAYVRKPQQISLSLNQDCELASEYHQLICDETTEYIKGIIGDPSWEQKLKDNMVRTKL